MKLKAKLIAAPLGSALVALAAGAGYGVWSHHDRAAERAAQARSFQQSRTLGEAQAQMATVHSGAYRMMAILNSLDESQVAAFARQAQDQLGALGRTLAALGEQQPEGSEARQRYQALGAQLSAYRKQVAKAIDMSAVDANMGVAAMKAADQGFAQLGRTMAEVVAAAEAADRARQDQATRRALSSAALFGLFALLATGGALLASWVMQRRLAADLLDAVDTSRTVAAGRLDRSPAVTRDDEIGDLQRAQAEMVQRLRESLQTVQQASQSIGTAASEISAGNGDLSQRTEQTASHLQQSASSIEQLSGAVRQSADAAAQASQLVGPAKFTSTPVVGGDGGRRQRPSRAARACWRAQKLRRLLPRQALRTASAR